MNMTKISPTEISTEKVASLVKKDLKQIKKIMSSQSLENVSWNKFAKKASTILANIQDAQKKVLEDEEGWKNLNKYKQLKTKNKRLQEIKHIHNLRLYLTQGYIFIQEFRAFIKKEQLEYLILFDDKDKQTMGKYTLEELLPTLNIQINSDKEFTLQINNVEKLQELKTNRNLISDQANENNIYQQIINLYNKIRVERYVAVQEARLQKETEKERERRGDKKMSGYELGQAGIAFETAARKAAMAIAAGISIGDLNATIIAQEQFKADTQAFYKAGDLSAYLTQQLFEEQKKLALELKRVSTASGSVGAQLTKSSTIEKGLKKIIDIINGTDKQAQEDVYNRLNKFFSSKETELERTIEKQVSSKVSDIINETIGTII